MSKSPAEKSPVQLFDLLVQLLQAQHMPEELVAKHLKPFAQGSRREPERLGRRYLINQGPYFTLTATFEKPSFNLYQVTVRLTPPAYVQIKAHAQALPAMLPAGGSWKNSWFGLWPKLEVSLAEGPRQAVTARFMGVLPGQKFIVLTRA